MRRRSLLEVANKDISFPENETTVNRMSPAVERAFLINTSMDSSADSGIFSWDVENNVVYADSALARLFGLDPNQTKNGLPLEDYLARVHPEDRPGLSKAITETIVADVPQQYVYRTMGAEGTYHAVASFGRAFHRRNGSLAAYSGIVIPADKMPVKTNQ